MTGFICYMFMPVGFLFIISLFDELFCNVFNSRQAVLELLRVLHLLLHLLLQ